MPRQEWGGAYEGPLARVCAERLMYSCPCGTMYPAEVLIAVNAAEDPAAAAKARAGTLNHGECPACDRRSTIDVAVVVHDPAASTFTLVLPASARHRELDERAKIYARLAASETPVPRYVRELLIAWSDVAAATATPTIEVPTPTIKRANTPDEVVRAAADLLRARDAAKAAKAAQTQAAHVAQTVIAPVPTPSVPVDEGERETGPFPRIDVDLVEAAVAPVAVAPVAPTPTPSPAPARAGTEPRAERPNPLGKLTPERPGVERATILERLAAAADRLAPERNVATPSASASSAAASGGVTVAVAAAAVTRPGADAVAPEGSTTDRVQKTRDLLPGALNAARAAALAAGAAASAALLTSEQAADASGVISSTSNLGRQAQATPGRSIRASAAAPTRDAARTQVTPAPVVAAPRPMVAPLDLEAATLDELLVLLEDPARRGAVALELTRRRDGKAIEPLFGALRRMTRGEAVRVLPALVKLGEPAVLHLVAGLRSKKSFLRQGCALALGVTKNAAAIEPLADLLVWEPTDVWREVARALGELGSGTVSPLIKRLDRHTEGDGADLTEEQRGDRIVWALAHVVARGNRAPIEALAEGSNPRHAELARGALELTASAKSNDAEVRADHTPRDQTVNRAFSRRFFEAMQGRHGFPRAASNMGEELELVEAELEQILDDDAGEILGDDDLLPG